MSEWPPTESEFQTERKRFKFSPDPILTDRPPPHSEEAEQGVLGCIILDSRQCLEPAAKRIESPDFFYDIRHQEIWSAMESMANNGGIDAITLSQKIKDRNQIDSCGGLGYVASLSNCVPSTANLPHYLDIVCEKRVLRQVIRTCVELTGRAFEDSGDIDSVVAYLRGTAERLGRSRNRLPPIEDAKSISDSIIPLPSEIVKGVLHQGTKLALGGGSKTCKTWILLDLAISISHGVPWLGFPTEQSRVLYLNFEIQPGFLRKRLTKIADAKGVLLSPDCLDIWNLRGYDAPFDQILPEITREIRSRNYSLVILDPIYKTYGNLDENKAGDIARLMTSIGRLTVETRAAIAFAAHFSKGNQSQKEAIDRISGSGVFARDPDSILTMTVHEQDHCFTLDGTLRNLPPFHPFVIQWQFPLMTPKLSLDASKLKKHPGPDTKHHPDDLLAIITNNPLRTSEWQKAAANLPKPHSISRATFYRLIDELEASGKISQSLDDSWSPSHPPQNNPASPNEND